MAEQPHYEIPFTQREEFEALYLRTRQRAYNLAYRMLGDRAYCAPHSPVNAAGRFSRKALIPSRMSVVVAISPK